MLCVICPLLFVLILTMKLQPNNHQHPHLVRVPSDTQLRFRWSQFISQMLKHIWYWNMMISESKTAAGRQTSFDSSQSYTVSQSSLAGGGRGEQIATLTPAAPMMKVIAQLWCHECCRTFSDRLISSEGRWLWWVWESYWHLLCCWSWNYILKLCGSRDVNSFVTYTPFIKLRSAHVWC